MVFIRRNSPFTPQTIIIGGADPAGPIFKSTIIVNSGVMRLGDVVGVVSGAGVANSVVVRRYNAAGDKILGICVGFGRENGKSVAFDAGSVNEVTVGAANETTGGRIFAYVDVTPYAVWSAPFVGTIHGTAVFGYGAQVECGTASAAGTLTETTVSRTVSAHLGFACLGPDEKDTTRGLVTVVEGLYRGQQTAS